jgi:hypothetical protein
MERHPSCGKGTTHSKYVMGDEERTGVDDICHQEAGSKRSDSGSQRRHDEACDGSLRTKDKALALRRFFETHCPRRATSRGWS